MGFKYFLALSASVASFVISARLNASFNRTYFHGDTPIAYAKFTDNSTHSELSSSFLQVLNQLEGNNACGLTSRPGYHLPSEVVVSENHYVSNDNYYMGAVLFIAAISLDLFECLNKEFTTLVQAFDHQPSAKRGADGFPYLVLLLLCIPALCLLCCCLAACLTVATSLLTVLTGGTLGGGGLAGGVAATIAWGRRHWLGSNAEADESTSMLGQS